MPVNDPYAHQPVAKPKNNPMYDRHYEQNKEDAFIGNYSHDHRRDQMMMKTQQERTGYPIKRTMDHHHHSGLNPHAMNQNVTMKAVGGPMRYNPEPMQRKPPGKVESFMGGDDDDDEDGFGEGKGRSTRGLRVLSLKVKEIVAIKKRTSYKDVAESLTLELRQKMGTKSHKEDSKDEQNVKRRVYDALNVLIAAGVLRKEGKVVYSDDTIPANGLNNNNSKKSRENREKILYDVQEARKRNKAKFEALHELVFKCLAIKNLIQTNKAKLEAEAQAGEKPVARQSSVSATRIEVVQENPALKPKNEDVIRFPFIVLLSSSPENSMNLNMDTTQRQLAIESKKAFNIFGDIDVLLKMGLHYVSREMFEQIIPYELRKYLPKYYLAALK